MLTNEIRARVQQLRTVIDVERYRYHVTGDPSLSEGALDALKKELSDLEEKYPELITPDSPTQRVAGTIAEGFKEVRHRVRMLSLYDAFSRKDMDDWVARILKLLPKEAEVTFFCELKIDGLAIGLRYEDGILVSGFTRGNGEVGEDVTANIKTIQSIPLRLKGEYPSDVEVRGEVYMEKKTLDEINEERKKKGESLYANVRNLAVGSLRQHDARITASRDLKTFIYDIVLPENLAELHSTLHEIAFEWGFRTSEHVAVCRSLDEVEKFYSQCQVLREQLPFQVDGIVVWINSIAQQKILGVVGKAPRYGIAWKFPAEQVTTQIEAVDWQVGRTGALTPVARLVQVNVAGTKVSRATLHNIDEIKRLDLHIGDTVVIQKAGDIIPEVVDVVRGLRSRNANPILPPEYCPICETKIIKRENEVALYCENKKCYAQRLAHFCHFTGKGALDIEGLGEKNIEVLLKADLINEWADVFLLRREDLLSLPRFGEVSADKLLNRIAQARTPSLGRLIFAFGIRHIGSITAHNLADHFGSIEKFMHAKENDFDTIHDIGPVMKNEIMTWLHNPHNQNAVSNLLKVGVCPVQNKILSQKLTQKVFVFTGTLKSMTRETASTMVVAQGGKVAPSLHSQVTHLVVGENPGSKVAEAKRKSITIVGEEEFLSMLHG